MTNAINLEDIKLSTFIMQDKLYQHCDLIGHHIFSKLNLFYNSGWNPFVLSLNTFDLYSTLLGPVAIRYFKKS